MIKEMLLTAGLVAGAFSAVALASSALSFFPLVSLIEFALLSVALLALGGSMYVAGDSSLHAEKKRYRGPAQQSGTR